MKNIIMFFFKYNYEGNRERWFYGPNSRLYHNIGIFSYTIVPILTDIYQTGVLNRNTISYSIIIGLFSIASIIKDKTSIICLAALRQNRESLKYMGRSLEEVSDDEE